MASTSTQLNQPTDLQFQPNSTRPTTGPKKLRKNLKVLYWNCRSLKRRQPELQTLVKDIDILFCAETRLSPHDSLSCTFPGFFTIRVDRIHNSGGGLLVAIRKSISYKVIKTPNISDKLIESIGLQITNMSPQVKLYAFYKPPSTTLSESQLDDICALASDPQQTILMGDFNAHHQAWNCATSKQGGDDLFYSIVNHDLMVHNTETITRIDENSQSNIDLVLSSVSLADKIKIGIYDETYGSDHFPVLTRITVEKNIYRKKTFKLTSVRTDWDSLRQDLDSTYLTKFCSHSYNSLTPLEKYELFSEHISHTIKSHTPNRTHVPASIHRNPVHWWDLACDEARKKRILAFRKWENTKDPLDFIQHKKAVAEATKLFKTKKKVGFRSFAGSLNLRTNASYVWESCLIFKHAWINNSPINKTENPPLDLQAEIALDLVSPPWCPVDPKYIPDCERNELLEQRFTFAEFNLALDSRKKNSRPAWTV